MTTEQFVVFLDILGFKERVFRNNQAAIVCWYQNNNAIKSYLDRIRTTVSGQSRKYIDNTLTLIKYVSIVKA